MNSEYGTRSPSELKEMARRQMKKATEVVPCVTVTEEHWKAMIELQKTQVALLEQIRDTLPSLATKNELTSLMDQQIDTLTRYSDACRDETVEFQELLTNLATDTENKLTTAAESVTEQVGKANESFSRNMSSEKETMAAYTKRLNRIALIPTAALIVWEAIRLILSLI